MFIFSLIAFILMLSFLVIIHELGHFFTARLFQIKIEEFGVGYPPRAHTLFTWKGIPFTLNWIPVGGFVKMLGEDGETTSPHSFNSKPKWQRLIVILAGATVNFLFGVLAFTVIYSYVGIPVPMSPRQTVIVEVKDGPGKQAGLKVDDTLLAVRDQQGDHITVGASNDFILWIQKKADQNVTITVKRGENTQDVVVHTRPANQIHDLGALGVVLSEPVVRTFYPWYRMPWESAKFGLSVSVDFSKTILEGLGKMGGNFVSHGVVPTDVAGPIGIMSMVDKQKIFWNGWLEILNFTAMFSINLAIMNVLPIPALDGGRAFFIGLEYLVGRKRIATIEAHANMIGFGLLIALIVLISIKDVIGLFR